MSSSPAVCSPLAPRFRFTQGGREMLIISLCRTTHTNGYEKALKIRVISELMYDIPFYFDF